MEDPWGSPWTSAEADASKTKEGGPEQPPRTFLSATSSTSSLPSVTVPAFSYHSPWDQNNDDEFGDWSSAGPGGAANTSSLSAWGGWPSDATGTGTAGTTSGQAQSSSSRSRSRENSVPSLGSLSRSRSRDGSMGKASPIAWPAHAATATSPGIRTISRSSSNSILRLPSLDPWASEASSGFDDSLPLPSPPKHASPKVSSGVPGRAQDSGVALTSPRHLGTLDTLDAFDTPRPTIGVKPDLDYPGWGEEEEEEQNARAFREDAETAGAGSRTDTDITPVTTPRSPHTPHAMAGADPEQEKEVREEEKGNEEEGETQSRASSSSSDDSRREDAWQDSPITSIDEDSKIRAPPQPSQRKTSNAIKVQDLVVMYDGLAKKAVAEPLIPARTPDCTTRASSRDPSHDNRVGEVNGEVNEEATGEATGEADGEANDGVNGEVDGEGRRDTENEAEEDRPSSRSRSQSGTPTAKMRLRASISRQQHQRGDSTSSIPSTASAPHPQGPPPRPPPPRKANFKELVAKFGPVQFIPDLKAIDVLFGNVEGDTNTDTTAELQGVDLEIPDRVLHDSYTSISERKTWYRVSRQGTTRLHNAGDDELYRRVTWPTSEVRAETIKIVRRWMEEDSIAGRPTLGGGAGSKNKGNIFGWDSSSSADPVRLDEVFVTRRSQPEGIRKPQTQSTQQPPSRQTETATATASGSPLSVRAAPAANFSWSSPVEAKSSRLSMTTTAATSSSRPTSLASATPGLLVAVPSRTSASSSRPPNVKSIRTETVAGAKQDDVDDEDDDWGEMVSSPTINGPGASQHQSNGSAPFPPLSETTEAGRACASRSTAPPLGKLASPFDNAIQTDIHNGEDVMRSRPASSASFGDPEPTLQQGMKPESAGLFAVSLDEYDSLVREIISNLPDLSYMLR